VFVRQLRLSRPRKTPVRRRPGIDLPRRELHLPNLRGPSRLRDIHIPPLTRDHNTRKQTTYPHMVRYRCRYNAGNTSLCSIPLKEPSGYQDHSALGMFSGRRRTWILPFSIRTCTSSIGPPEGPLHARGRHAVCSESRSTQYSLPCAFERARCRDGTAPRTEQKGNT
jgi:hypothetical protein